MSTSSRVRFAPSPTGYLHIGGARTALFNWIYAKKHGGTFVLRIEDTDPSRSKREHEVQIETDLNWLELNWQEGPSVGGDYGPYRQSERFDRYRKVIEQLLAEGKAYRCIATAEELDELRAGQRERGEKMMYDNRYRNANLGPDCGEHVIRLKTPLEGETVVDDQIKGRTVFQNAELDDYILVRSDGTPTYNFVCVVDDLDMGITLVLRGDDHLNNTPKQCNLYAALGQPSPQFAHVPMILGDDGKRLSKRHGATAVGLYREMGIVKEALFNYLTRLGWACGDMEIFTPQEVIDVFELSQINKAGAKWDMQKLLWCNQQWMMRLSSEVLLDRARPFIDQHSLEHGYTIDESKLLAAVVTMQERAQTLIELAEKMAFYFQDASQFTMDEEAAAKALQGHHTEALSAYVEFLRSVDETAFTATTLEEQSKAWGKEYNEIVKAAGGKKFKINKLFFPMRIALCGVGGGPGLFDVMEILGKEVSLQRLTAGVERCKAKG